MRRFALYAGVALVLAAIAALLYVRSYAVHRAEDDARSHTEFVAESLVAKRLRASDLKAPMRGARRRWMDRLARETMAQDGAMRVKLFRRDGLVVYSSDHSLIGSRPKDDDVDEALAGEAVSGVSSLNGEGGKGPNRKVLETYVPVSLPGQARPAGVFEIYSDYDPIADDARGIFLPLMAGIALLLLGLYFAYFPILRRVTCTLRRQMEEIRHQAHHDELTGLPNRTLFNLRAQEALAAAHESGGGFAVMLIDLDRFKEINDTLGHQSGDRLLSAIAANLPTRLRKEDTVARLGGDEFGIIASDIADASDALAIAEKVRAALARPQLIDGVELDVDASIGIALYPEHGDDVETLIRRADVALYRSKKIHAPALYASEHDHHSPARLALVSELRRAIENGDLRVVYQAQCDARDGRLQGVEALVRWQHPQRGLLMPDQFIPLAERTGVIRQLTAFVLDEALRQCKEWEGQGLDLSVAVNVSGRDLLDSAFPTEVEAALARRQVKAERLELEVMESTALTDPPRTRAILSRLRALGVRVAIDDFGTGNSSLAHLRRLPVATLKIDRSFVGRMLRSEDDLVIVRSMIDMAHNLGLDVVAEGVETEESFRRLAELGCDVAQGFLFGHPAEASAFTEAAGSPAWHDGFPRMADKAGSGLL